MVVTRSKSHKDPNLINEVKLKCGTATSMKEKNWKNSMNTRSKGRTQGNLCPNVSKPKVIDQKRSDRITPPLKVKERNKQLSCRSYIHDNDTPIAHKRPRMMATYPNQKEARKKSVEENAFKSTDSTDPLNTNSGCHSGGTESFENAEAQSSPIVEKKSSDWEDFGNTSEEGEKGSSSPTRMSITQDVCAEQNQTRGTGVRRSRRIVVQKIYSTKSGSGSSSDSFSSSSESSGEDDDDYETSVKSSRSSKYKSKNSVQSEVSSCGSSRESSVSEAKPKDHEGNCYGDSRMPAKQSALAKKSSTKKGTKSKSAESKKSLKNQTKARPIVTKPPKPWQKTSETIIEGDIVVPPRTLRRGEKKMLKFRVLAAALAVGRKYEMTDEEAIEILDQIRTGNSLKQSASVQSTTVVAHESKGDASSSEDEWEELELADINDSKFESVQVTLNKVVEKDWWALYLRQEVNKVIRNNWENSHKVNILCYIGHLQYLKKVILEENLIPSLMLTKMPAEYQDFLGKPMTIDSAGKIAKWYHNTFKASGAPIKYEPNLCRYDLTERYSEMITHNKFENDADRAALLFALFVSLGCITRICVNTLPIPRKWDESLTNDTAESLPSSVSKQTKKTGRNLSKKSSAAENQFKGMVRNYWIEYWDIRQKRWICVDPLAAVVADASLIEINISKPVLYVLSIDNEGGVRDVTARYASDFSRPDFRRRRTDQKWIADTLRKNYIRADRKRSELEDFHFRQDLVNRPLPSTLSEYKNHPLYVLEKDLLKFEGIYPKPEDQKPLGEVRGHKVYPRSTVYTLQSANNWIKMARSVKEGEKPYKVVKARPNLHVPAEEREQRYLDVFGYWQTEPYRPPKVIDGRIPCNEFGNVYMYQPSMCPIGAVHLRLPGLPSIARRLGGLQCVPAVVGWDFNSCTNFPIMEGACVLEEDVEKFVSEWKRLESSRESREKKRKEERVLGNWRRIIRGVLRLHYVRTKFGKTKTAAKTEKNKDQIKEENEQSSLIIDRTVMAPCREFTHDDLMRL